MSSRLLVVDSVTHESLLARGKGFQPGRRSVRGNCLRISGTAVAAVAHASTVSNAVSVAVGSSCSLIDGLLDLLSTDPWGYAVLDSKAQGGAKGILLGLFDSSYLFGPHLLLTLGIIIVPFGIPRQIPSLLPAAHRCHEAVTEVILAMLIILDIVPLEVGSTATTALLADRREEIHCAMCEIDAEGRSKRS